jgi:prepilin-type processing-associated H-X9-DG protein
MNRLLSNFFPGRAGVLRLGRVSYFAPPRQHQQPVRHFWSLHPGGAHFLFADGSVHFLSYSAAPILPALASRAGGETANSWE